MAAEQHHLCCVTATDSDMGKRYFAVGNRNGFINGRCGSDEKIPAFVVPSTYADDEYSGIQIRRNPQHSVKWSRQRSKSRDLG